MTESQARPLDNPHLVWYALGTSHSFTSARRMGRSSRVRCRDCHHMKTLDKLHFLIHGFCYDALARGATPRRPYAQLEPYLEHERECSERWRSRLEDLPSTEALVIIPWTGNLEEPASSYYASAASILGDRFYMLECADAMQPEFWSMGKRAYYQAIVGELASAFVGQGTFWNKEEVVTDLHCLACCWQFQAMLAERGYALDKAITTAEGWGASFEGCVTKYTLTLRRMFNLSNVIEIDYEMTVPDTSFLLGTVGAECVLLKNGLRLFLFKTQSENIALYTSTAHSLADPVIYVRLPLPPHKVRVKSKQGIRLWPQPEAYVLPSVPFGYHEPAQKLVNPEGDGLCVPVSAGFVYRLAKAPAYIFAPSDMPYAEFRDRLIAAQVSHA